MWDTVFFEIKAQKFLSSNPPPLLNVTPIEQEVARALITSIPLRIEENYKKRGGWKWSRLMKRPS